MTPREVLELARSEKFTWVDYFAYDNTPFDAGEEEGVDHALELGPGMSPAEIGAFEERLPAKLPSDVRNLLSFASGFTLGADEVAFSQYNDWGYDFLLPHVAVLEGDGLGNSWVIEINPETGVWRHVWFECHDPPVLQYLCETLAEFIDGVLDGSRFEKCKQGHRSIVDRAYDLKIKLWRNNKRFPKAISLRDSDDRALAEFVASLPDTAFVIDLRSPNLGDGFDWGSLIPGPRPVQRAGNGLLFAIEPKKGLLRRLFGT